jgi:hypothetical protein
VNCGVYYIRCWKTGRLYVGQSGNIRRRWAEHRRALQVGRHCNKAFQAEWSLYGPKYFDFLVAEPMDFSIDRMLDRELKHQLYFHTALYGVRLRDFKSVGEN